MQTYLVWILDQHVLSLRVFHAQIDDRPYNAPSVSERNVQLASKVQRSIRRGAQDNVASVIAWVGAGDVPVKPVSQHSLSTRSHWTYGDSKNGNV